MHKQAKIISYHNDQEMGWNLFGPWYDGMTDFEVGEYYLKAFFTSSYNTEVKITYDVYLETLRTNLGQLVADKQIEGLGLGIRMTQLSKSDVIAAADQLASISKGLTPTTIGDFRQALVGQATATPFTDAVVNNPVVKGFEKIGNVLINVGDSALESLDFMANVNRYLKIVFPVLGGYLFYQFYLKKFIPKNATVENLKKHLQ